MNQAGFHPSAQSRANSLNAIQKLVSLSSRASALLFGLRLWVAVCLALYIAFWLQLDNAYWAGASVAAVCQPSLGASLRKAWFRVIGTAVGAVAIVVLTGYFPQDRMGFLIGLALWGGVCGFVATLLPNFAGYAAALAGVTAAIIASDELGAVGGTSGDVLILAVTRATEICIGIICAGVVLAGTNFGDARRRLAIQLAMISAEIAGRLTETFLLVGSEQSNARAIQRDLVQRVAALDPVIDEARGESLNLRLRSPVLQVSVQGLFAALCGWRAVVIHLERLQSESRWREAGIVLESIPRELRLVPVQDGIASWMVDSSIWRDACASAVRTLASLPADTPSLRLLADKTAETLIGIRRGLDGLLLIVDPDRILPKPRPVRLSVPDLLPALMNAARVFVTIGAAEFFWIATGWPNGAQAIVFAAIAVIVFSPRADQAYPTTVGFMIGASLAAVLAAIVKFAVLPCLTTFVSFSLAIGLVLVPVGMLLTQRQSPILMAMVVVFLPLLAPENQTSFDVQQFYNTSLAVVLGVGGAALAFRLLPPLSPALRTRRLLKLTLRDLRRMMRGSVPRTAHGWTDRICGRLFAMPEQAEPIQRAQLLAALSVGKETIRLRRVARRLGREIELDSALEAVVLGNSVVAGERLGRLDRALAAVPSGKPGAQLRLRVRASVLAVSEALACHAAYFDSGVV
jgi:uncharacterized membrane protein YccC